MLGLAAAEGSCAFQRAGECGHGVTVQRTIAHERTYLEKLSELFRRFVQSTAYSSTAESLSEYTGVTRLADV